MFNTFCLKNVINLYNNLLFYTTLGFGPLKHYKIGCIHVPAIDK